MRALALAVTLLLTATAAAEELRRPAPAPQPGAPAHGRGTPVVLEREDVAARLARLESLLERAWDKSEHGQGQGALRKAVWELDGLKRMLANAPDARSYRPPPPPAQQPPPKPAVRSISDGDFQQILSVLARGEYYYDNKLQVLESAAAHHSFRVSHVQTFLKRFYYEENKVKVVRMLWPRVLDRQNGYLLYESFYYSHNKDVVRQIISK